MATRDQIQPATTTEIIDLTNDDVDIVIGYSNNSFPLPLPHHQPPPPHRGFPTSSARTETETRRDDAPPAKRQRTADRQQYDLAAALEKCLEAQVFPYVEHATKTLSRDIYDLDRLGGKVARTIVDKNFERVFIEGGGRIPRNIEHTIAAGIPRLVTKLAAGPDYRWSTLNSSPAPSTTAPFTVPAILPSIEKELSDHDDNEWDSNSNEADADGDLYSGSDDPGSDRDNTRGDDQLEEKPDRPVLPSTVYSPHNHRPLEGSFQQLRTRAKASQWQSGKTRDPVSEAKRSLSFGLPLRPYLSALERQQIMSGVQAAFYFQPLKLGKSPVFHVDFNNAETDYLHNLARILYGRPVISGLRSTLRDLRNIFKKDPGVRTSLVEIHAKGYLGYDPPPLSLMRRTSNDITNFLNDLYKKRLNAVPKSLFVEVNINNSVAQSEASRANKIPALLLRREIAGNRLMGGRTYQNFITTAKSNREDYLEPRVEWTDCAGDIMTVSWLSNTQFICGATTHSDSHNQQYNKPGNLLLGSAATNTLHAYPDHRIIRPVVSSGDNALDSMIASQDPWLFTSVVSSDYDPSCDLAFTSSFDKTVKVWKAENGSMVALGTWNHGGRVNFVVASKNGTGAVATAADVPMEAVRVYHLDRSNISRSSYDSYSCTRVHDEDYVPSEKWAYYPAAIRWGLAPTVKHLLLIGYSPRSRTENDHDIPEDKLKSGELCLWDTITRTQVKVSSAKTQNVFEVAWHPSRASFAAATSASQILEKTDQIPRTQIRIFEMNKEGQYGAMKTLDCSAIDINELSIMPNSLLYSYVAASCTDGNVYVWDTAASDWPMCILKHGDPVEEILGEREEEDIGVKFAAWATTADRLYTGSSDGVVKVWNIRHGRGILIKNLIEVAAPITYGAFSPDFTKLVIGDGSGRVYLLALDTGEDRPLNPAISLQTISGNQRTIRRPRSFIPHREVPPPHKLTEGQESSRGYLQTAQLVLHPDPTVGVVQGVNYAETGLFRSEAHMNQDPNEPLLATFQSKQQESQPDLPQTKLLRQLKQRDNGLVNGWHEDGFSNDKDDQTPHYQDTFDHATWLALKKEKAELDDRLIELHYETSILDSDEEMDGDE